MAFFDTLKQNLMTTGQTTVDKAKTTVEILKLKGLAFRTKLNILFWNIKKYNTFIKCNNIVRSIYKNIN